MPLYKKGEMFDFPGVHIVTANSYISGDGTLVMTITTVLFPSLQRQRGTEKLNLFSAARSRCL